MLDIYRYDLAKACNPTILFSTTLSSVAANPFAFSFSEARTTLSTTSRRL